MNLKIFLIFTALIFCYCKNSVDIDSDLSNPNFLGTWKNEHDDYLSSVHGRISFEYYAFNSDGEFLYDNWQTDSNGIVTIYDNAFYKNRWYYDGEILEFFIPKNSYKDWKYIGYFEISNDSFYMKDFIIEHYDVYDDSIFLTDSTFWEGKRFIGIKTKKFKYE